MTELNTDLYTYIPTMCNCSQFKDVRSRCQPQDKSFRYCKARAYTAQFYIENRIMTLADFVFLGPKIQHHIKQLFILDQMENY